MCMYYLHVMGPSFLVRLSLKEDYAVSCYSVPIDAMKKANRFSFLRGKKYSDLTSTIWQEFASIWLLCLWASTKSQVFFQGCFSEAVQTRLLMYFQVGIIYLLIT